MGSDNSIYLTTVELANRWRLTTRTLERWRSEGCGPPWVTLVGSVRYPLDDVIRYESSRRSEGNG